MMDNIRYGQDTLKNIVENAAKKEEKEHQQTGDNVDLTPMGHERALKEAYKSFVVPGLPKADVDSYIEKVKPYVKSLIEKQLGEMNSAKVIMTLWVKWKKPLPKPAFTPDAEDLEGAEDIEVTGDQYIRIEMPFNSLMTEFFNGSNIEELLERMFAHIKTQTENPKFPESEFTLDHIMHLNIKFHKFALTRGSSYIQVLEWIAKKKAVINPQNRDDEECFKWAVIASLNHEEIDSHPQRITKLQRYENQYNWGGLKFRVAINKRGKFEKNNPDIAVNVLFTGKKGIFTARRSEFNCNRKKQVNLLMVVDGENRHYTAIKNISRLLKSLNAKNHQGTYHYCINCLNGFRTESARDKHYEYCRVRVM